MATNDNMMRLIVGFVAAFLIAVSTTSSAVETRFMQGLSDTRYQQIDFEII